MIKQNSYTIIWDRIALDHFKDILDFFINPKCPSVQKVREGILSRLDYVKKNAHIFVIDKLKDNPNKEFRAFVIYSYRITYQIKEEAKEIRVLRIRHTSREPFGY